MHLALIERVNLESFQALRFTKKSRDLFRGYFKAWPLSEHLAEESVHFAKTVQ